MILWEVRTYFFPLSFNPPFHPCLDGRGKSCGCVCVEVGDTLDDSSAYLAPMSVDVSEASYQLSEFPMNPIQVKPAIPYFDFRDLPHFLRGLET